MQLLEGKLLTSQSSEVLTAVGAFAEVLVALDGSDDDVKGGDNSLSVALSARSLETLGVR